MAAVFGTKSENSSNVNLPLGVLFIEISKKTFGFFEENKNLYIIKIFIFKINNKNTIIQIRNLIIISFYLVILLKKIEILYKFLL